MQNRPPIRPHLPHPSPDFVRRQMTVGVIREYLRDPEHGAERASSSLFLEGKRALHRQPWRRPPRPAVTSASMLDFVRRYEAYSRKH
jgi:hypothetical protein